MSKQLLSQSNSKKFKWVPDNNLCQSKDCSSKFGSKAEENLLATTTGMLDSYRMKFDDAPPALACVPQIKWKCPPVFIINNNWHVVAGEQSEETRTQMFRQLRLLEAIYPHQSAIPSSPSVSPGLGECDYDDHETPLIPISPCGEEDAVDYESKTYPIPSSAPVQQEEAVKFAQHITLEEPKVAVNEKSVEIHTGLEGGVVAAAITAFAELMERNESGQIDTDLLGNILSDPKKIETLSFDSTKITPMNGPMSGTSVSLPSIDCLSTVFQKPVNEHSNMHNVQQSSRLASNVLTNLGATQVPKLSSSLQTTMPSMKSTSQASMMNREFQPFLWATMPVMRSISQASMMNEEPSMALLPRHGLLHENYRKENQNFPPETQFHPLMSFPRYSSSSDGLISPTVVPVTRVVKDASYYKRLIELHGTDKSGGREEIMHQYRPRTSELTPAAGKRDARGKIPRPCKFFNSSRGCRNGSTCPFQHDSSLKLQAGRLADVYSSKRIKLSKKIS
ncbi:zinc finger CCCH domain-containing protein 6-like [Amaranthus tricolor]|uniref:zinc finger CCCH domain-containing protein 6-like n=1 Tax=Amaranthus tricolor TaxID=29722 RepID=UPI00258C4101|nr:zinc finger CCCH domain-containing protein 6-like [Amaranthus tricolor]